MFSRWWISVGVAAAVLAASGCGSSGSDIDVPGGVRNRTRVALVSAVCGAKAYPLEFSVVPAAQVARSGVLADVTAYTVNALKSLGLNAAADRSRAPMIVTVDFGVAGEAERTVSYEIVARSPDGEKYWSVSAACTARPEGEWNEYLPGLVAASIPAVGKNQKAEPLNLGRYPGLLRAIRGE